MAPEEMGQEGSEDLASEIANSLTAAAEPTPTVDTTPVEPTYGTDPAAAPSTEQPREVGDHPAWTRFKETLGEDAYGQIKPYLAEMSENYHKHVTKVNGELEGFSPYRDYLQMEGMSPDYLARSLSVASRIQQDPGGLYRELGQYLQDNGLLEGDPAEEALNFGDEGADPRYAQLEGQFAELQQQNQQMQERWNQAAYAAEVQHHTQIAEQQVQTQLKDLREANPWIGNKEAGLIIQRAQQMLEQTGKMPELSAAAAPFIEMRQAALSTPRANDSAPRLPGSGGGIPSGTKPMSENSRQDDINLLADALVAAKAK